MKYLKMFFFVVGLTTLSIVLYAPQSEAYCYWRHGVRYCNYHHPHYHLVQHPHKHCWQGAHGHWHCRYY